MTHRNLRSLLRLLKSENELTIIEHPCDPVLEIPEIHRQVIAVGGPALYFKNPVGYDFPVVTNLYGTPKRIEAAFGQDPELFLKKLIDLSHLAMDSSPDFFKGIKDVLPRLLKIGTRSVRRAPAIAHHYNTGHPRCHLTSLPALHCWARDGGHFLTLPQVLTKCPLSGKHNLGIYRVQLYNQTEAGLHFQIHKGGGFHHFEAEKLNKNLPVSISLGGPPALLLGSIMPLPEGVPETLMVSLIMGEKIPTLQPKSHLPVFAEAEFTLAGYSPPHIRRDEGPFGDHYGYYSETHPFPIFKLQKILHRKNPIYPATVVGKPRQEDYFLGEYLQKLLSPVFPLVMPAVTSLWSYGETGFHSLAAATVKERYQREGMVSAFRILGENQLSLTKFLLITDQNIQLSNFKKTLITILERVNPERDIYVFPDLSMDTLDYCGSDINKGSKGVLAGFGAKIRELPTEASMGESSCNSQLKNFRVYCPGCLVIDGPNFTSNPNWARELVDLKTLSRWPLIILVDNSQATCKNDESFLWSVFTRFEPEAHIYFNYPEKSRMNREHRSHKVAKSFPIIIDSRRKPGFPEELFCDKKTEKRVNHNWKNYFPNTKVERL